MVFYYGYPHRPLLVKSFKINFIENVCLWPGPRNNGGNAAPQGHAICNHLSMEELHSGRTFNIYENLFVTFNLEFTDIKYIYIYIYLPNKDRDITSYWENTKTQDLSLELGRKQIKCSDVSLFTSFTQNIFNTSISTSTRNWQQLHTKFACVRLNMNN